MRWVILARVLWWWARHPRATQKEIRQYWTFLLLERILHRPRTWRALHGLKGGPDA